jgi:hypothetical protein
MRTRALAAALLLLPAARAAAGQVTLRLQTTTQFDGGALRVALTVTNQGDTEAIGVRPRLRFLEREATAATHASLGPGKSLDALLVVPAPYPGAGRWPYALAIDYVDSNAHPFQAFFAGLVTFGAPPPFGLLLDELEATPLAERGTLRVSLRNPAAAERRASVRVLTSADLDPPPDGRDVAIPAAAAAELTLPLGLRTALAGSRYPAFVLVEYQDGGVHQALIAETALVVRERRPRLFAPLLLASLLVLLAWCAALLLRRLRSAGPA